MDFKEVSAWGESFEEFAQGEAGKSNGVFQNPR